MHMHPPELRTAAQGGEHLARVQQVLGVKRTFDHLLLLQIHFGKLVGHEVTFFNANAVFTAEHPARIHAGDQHIGPELLGFFQIARFGGIIHDDGVQVAIPRMEAVGVIQPVFLDMSAILFSTSGSLLRGMVPSVQ